MIHDLPFFFIGKAGLCALAPFPKRDKLAAGRRGLALELLFPMGKKAS